MCYLSGSGVDIDGEEALNLFSRSASTGDAYSQYYLGWCLENGEGVPAVDFSEAYRWYIAAADQYDSYALFALGQMYEEGRGVDVIEIIEAMRCYKRAAKLGNESAIAHIPNLKNLYKEAVSFHSSVRVVLV